jgi:sugar phosphate isomerase/epimerase
MPLAAFPKCYLDALVHARSMTTVDWLDIAARELDVDGVELYWPMVAGLDGSELRALGRAAAERGLALPMMCASPDFTRRTRAEFLTEVTAYRRTLHASAELGVRFVRVLSGQRRPGLDRETGVSLVLEALDELIPFAGSLGLVLTLENHFKDGSWPDVEFAVDPDVYLEILARVPPSPAFGVNFDPSNALVAGWSPLDLLQRVLDRVVTLHASDRRLAAGWTLDEAARAYGRSGPGSAALVHGVVGDGEIDYEALLSTLAGAGFAGWISIEDGDDPVRGVDDLRRSAAFLRGAMRRHGLA